MKGKRRRRPARSRVHLSIPARASRILNIVLLTFFLILVRLWYLTVVQHDDRLEESRRPQRRVVVEGAQRGTIRDRFNIPLAINRVQYNASILYSDIREIPSTRWSRDENGERVRRYPRREYIRDLSEKLAIELDLDADRIEDLIHSKAALFPNVPYVVRENIEEEKYYRLRAIEYDWPGICAERAPVRYYPKGRVACDVLGYMGAISQEQYESVAGEIRRLRDYLEAQDEGRFPPLPEGMESTKQVCERLAELRDRAYSIHDLVGKGGVELRLDEALRGYRGRRFYLSDIYGNYLRPLPGGQEPVAGKRVILSISSELQEFAEELIAQNERIRDGRSFHFDREKRVYRPLKQPWIKGGAIVAMDPNTGELLALASYPRFDPNDFVPAGDESERLRRRSEVRRWLESEECVGQIWDRKQTLRREVYEPLTQVMREEEIDLDWKSYLQFILPASNRARQRLEEMATLNEAARLQSLFGEILEIAEGWQPREVVDALYCREMDLPFSSGASVAYVEAEQWLCNPRLCELQRELDGYLAEIPRNYDKLLLIDLCRLAVDADSLSPGLLTAMGEMELATYRDATAAAVALQEAVREMAAELFHDLDFRLWREEHGKAFLKEKRQIEREEKRYQRPYLDYFDAKERAMFAEFWEKNRWPLLLALVRASVPADDQIAPYLDHFTAWSQELKQGAHRALPWIDHYDELSRVVEPLDYAMALDFCHTLRDYRELNAPLFGRYRYLRGTLGAQTMQNLAAAFYPRYGFGFGRSYAFRQAAPLGSIFKLFTAYEAVNQHYTRSILDRGWCSNLSPLTIVDDVHRSKEGKKGWNVGFFKDGRAIPMYYRGGRLLPTHRRHVGEISLIEAMEVSSNSYFGLLVGEHLDTPSDLRRAAESLSFGARTGIDLPGEYAGRLPDDLDVNRSGAYAFSIGQHSLVVTPLQTAVAVSAIANRGKVFEPKVVSLLAGSDPLRSGEALFGRSDYSFRETLELLGIGFPLFTGADRGVQETEVTPIPKRIVREIPLEEPVREILLQALQAAVLGERGGARPSGARGYHDHPWIIRDYVDLKEQIVGKTSTAEIVENVDLDADHGTNTYNHVWFAGISFQEEEISRGEFGRPELVVVVFLRFADYGREAAPLAAQIVKKWREIKTAHSPAAE